MTVVGWELNLVPLQEQHDLLTGESFSPVPIKTGFEVSSNGSF